jgi:hypothetical protein
MRVALQAVLTRRGRTPPASATAPARRSECVTSQTCVRFEACTILRLAGNFSQDEEDE